MDAFTLQYPMQWSFDIVAKFDDTADYSHAPTKVQKREGMLFVPNSLDKPLQVQAAQRGRVSQINYYEQGYGHFVTIVHEWGLDTFVTWYGHLDTVIVSIGQNINVGDVIGIAGRSGSAEQVCLFFTLQHLGKGRKNYVVEDVVDPLEYLTDKSLVLNEATWDADVTVPDGSILLCGEMHKKIWRIRNTGTTTWDVGYELVFFSDVNLATQNVVPLPHALPGALVQLAIDIVVPAIPGSYRSTWKPRTSTGEFFPFEQWVQIEARTTQDEVRKPQLKFIDDITIKDKTVIESGKTFVKTWRVRNVGNTVWTDYVLKFLGDHQLGGPNSIPLPELRPQQEEDISVELTAPQTAGTYRSTWQPYDENGNPFDFELWTEIVVRPEGGNNPNEIFPSPISGSWLQGRYRFMTPTNYGDGKHNGVDYVNCGNQLVTSSGIGEVYKVFRCIPCENKSFDQLGFNEVQRSQAFSSEDYVYGFGNLVIVRYAWSDLPELARQAMEEHFKGHYAFVYYAHLTDDIRVKEHDSVVDGTPIGLVGNTGNSSAAHLHLEVRCYPQSNPRPLVSNVDPVLLDPEKMFEF